MVDILARITSSFGQTIATSKTKAMVVQSKRSNQSEIDGVKIQVNGQDIQQVQEFKYLGSVQNGQGNMDNEVERRRAAMLQSYGRFQHILLDKRINLRIRLTLINAIIVPHGCYGCQAWNSTRLHLKRLESIYCFIIRKTLAFSNARMPLVEVINSARRWNEDIFPLECKIRQAQLRYFGHLVRSDSHDKPREVAYAFVAGTGKQMGPNSHFQVDLEAAISLLNLDPKRWEHWSRNRQNDEIEELSGLDSQEADEESVANGVQYERIVTSTVGCHCYLSIQ